MTEVYDVQITNPNFPGERPMPYIVVGGKIQSTPCQLNLKLGDRVIIERKPTATPSYEVPPQMTFVCAGDFEDVPVVTGDRMSEQETKCPMCGIPWTKHDGVIATCRRYHRLRVEVKGILTRHPIETESKTAVKRILYQIQQAIEAAENQ